VSLERCFGLDEEQTREAESSLYLYLNWTALNKLKAYELRMLQEVFTKLCPKFLIPMSDRDF
jgi:hypothetical protein